MDIMIDVLKDFSANLYKILRDPDAVYSDEEEEDVEPPSVKCDLNDTMKAMKIKEGQNFIIRLEEEYEQ